MDQRPEHNYSLNENRNTKTRATISQFKVAVVGAGPAGLTAAHTLVMQSSAHRPVILEAGHSVGGIARTEQYKGYRFDIGGHRFYTKSQEVSTFWRQILGNEFVFVQRKSRIYFEGKYYAYPLKMADAVSKLGPIKVFRIALSYLRWKIFPHRSEENLEEWVVNRFGMVLFQTFFKSYTEKVWGIPCTEIRADWAAQRIKNMSLTKAILKMVTGANRTTSMIEQFEYPRLGPGQMWEEVAGRIEANGGRVMLDTTVDRVHWSDQSVTAIEYRSGDGTRECIEADWFINTMSLRDLIAALSPAPPAAVVEAAQSLKYRDFTIVTLILDHPDPFPDQWIYVHSPEVKVGRIQNFRAWSADMVPHPNRASIGMEYFCQQNDELWESDNAELIELARRELQQLGLADAASVIDGTVIRQPAAYPVYDATYQTHLDVIRRWLATLTNFQTIGRNGMHRYNNQDHSMLAGMAAAQNILGQNSDVWAVNTERSYYEKMRVDQK